MQFKNLLLPFSALYGAGIAVRNWLFDKGVLSSVSFQLPVIVVGNLSAGGTGKTPQVEYLLELLGEKVAVLSRGYGRKSKGFLEITTDKDAMTCGDEPLQQKMKFPAATIAVCENRAEGIRTLLKMGSFKAIILDDAFQHRYVKPSLSILLTEWSKPYFNDRLLPEGRLREPASSAKRADIIVVTKSPENISAAQRNDFIARLDPGIDQKVYFSFLKYGSIYHAANRELLSMQELKEMQVLMITGIANPAPMKSYLQPLSAEVTHLKFSDHHDFTQADIASIERKFNTIAGRGCIITTEKDFARLMDTAIAKLPLYILPVKTEFNAEDKNNFNNYIVNHVGKDQ